MGTNSSRIADESDLEVLLTFGEDGIERTSYRVMADRELEKIWKCFGFERKFRQLLRLY